MTEKEFVEKNKLKLNSIAKNLLNTNGYGYFYLIYAHRKIKELGVDNIVVGSSHSTYMIIEEMFNGGCVNLSINSQDIYYSFLQIKKAVENSKTRIKRCFIVMGWYNLHQDISLEKNDIGKKAFSIESTFFDDLHNAPKSESIWQNLKQIYKDKREFKYAVNYIEKKCTVFFYKTGSYHNDLRVRSSTVLEDVEWSELSQEERDDFGQKRAEPHNKGIKYTDSINENINLLYEMLLFLENNDIQPIVVIPPYTKEYSVNILPELKKLLSDVLQNAPVQCVTLDMNLINIWTDNDFVDADHLSEKGAQKATKIIVKTFCKDDCFV